MWETSVWRTMMGQRQRFLSCGAPLIEVVLAIFALCKTCTWAIQIQENTSFVSYTRVPTLTHKTLKTHFTRLQTTPTMLTRQTPCLDNNQRQDYDLHRHVINVEAYTVLYYLLLQISGVLGMFCWGPALLRHLTRVMTSQHCTVHDKTMSSTN